MSLMSEPSFVYVGSKAKSGLFQRGLMPRRMEGRKTYAPKRPFPGADGKWANRWDNGRNMASDRNGAWRSGAWKGGGLS